MSVLRSQLGRSPGILTFNGGTFFTRQDISNRHVATWKEVITTVYGAQDKVRTDWVIKNNFLLWGAWENLPILFPAYAMGAQIGASVFGNADVPAVIQGTNNDRITYVNSAITKLSGLYLGVDEDLFAAGVEVTSLIGNGKNPEDVSSYIIHDSNAYNEGAFSRANFKRTRFSAAWGAVAGFGAVLAQKGFHIDWALDATPVPVDGLGTVDYTVKGFKGMTKFIPIGPSRAQINAASQLNTTLGTAASSNAADLAITGSNAGPQITMNSAFMAEHGFEFGIEPLRNGEITLETVRGFNGGVGRAVGTVA